MPAMTTGWMSPGALRIHNDFVRQDFFYICIGHLGDKGFASPVVDAEAQAAKRREEAKKKEIEKVVKEYEEKQRKKKEKRKAKEDENDKEKDKKEKKAEADDDAKEEKDKDEKVRFPLGGMHAFLTGRSRSPRSNPSRTPQQGHRQQSCLEFTSSIGESLVGDLNVLGLC